MLRVIWWICGGRLQFVAASAAIIATILGTSMGAKAGEDPASAIRAALEQWRLDFNARKSADICDLFATDLLYDIRGLPEQNYALLCARLHRALTDHTKTFQYGLHIKEIIVSGTLAAVRLTWTSTVIPAHGPSVTHEEPGLDIFQRQPDGTWKIIRYLAYEED
jgi:ketosteroid isomerase-like protein